MDMAGTDFGSAMTMRPSLIHPLLAGETEWKPVLMAIASMHRWDFEASSDRPLPAEMKLLERSPANDPLPQTPSRPRHSYCSSSLQYNNKRLLALNLSHWQSSFDLLW